MKRLIKKVRRSTKRILFNAKCAVFAFLEFSRTALSGNAGEGYIDTAVKILIAVVLGALLLGGLYALFGETVMPTLRDKISGMFNYGG